LSQSTFIPAEGFCFHREGGLSIESSDINSGSLAKKYTSIPATPTATISEDDPTTMQRAIVYGGAQNAVQLVARPMPKGGRRGRVLIQGK